MTASLALGIGGHQSPVMGTDEWLTPPHIVKALGDFDLDPCSGFDATISPVVS